MYLLWLTGVCSPLAARIAFSMGTAATGLLITLIPLLPITLLGLGLLTLGMFSTVPAVNLYLGENAPLHFLWLLALRLDGFHNLLDEARLRYSTYNFNAVVHYGLGHAPHLVALGHINELGDFDHISGDVFVFDC